MSNDNLVLTHQIAGVGFSFYSPDEIKRLSVKKITNHMSEDNFGQPLPGGLYDPAMGPVERNQR